MVQADELGVQLAHGACFDVRGGISVFHKIAALEAGTRAATATAAAAGKDRLKKTGWTDTHPASEERFSALLALVEAQHLDRGSQSHCRQVESDLQVAWKAAAATAAWLSTLTSASAMGRSG